MFDEVVESSSGLSVIQVRWTMSNEQQAARKNATTVSGDVLGDTDLLAKEKKTMTECTVSSLLETLETRHGFVLGGELINASEEVLEEFLTQWIAKAIRSGGLSREMLEKALAGEGPTTQSIGFAEEWQLLLKQISGPDYCLEMGERSFELRVKKAGRTFRFPYCSTAMSACNRLIQHYDNE